MMLANIIVIILLLVMCGYGIRRIVKNIRSGKSICGCQGDCSKCSGCK